MKIGDGVDALDAPPTAAQRDDLLAQVFDHQTAVVLAHADHLGLRVVQRDDAADVARQLKHRHVAGIDQQARDQVKPLLRARGDDDLRRRDACNAASAEHLGDGFEQGLRAARLRWVLRRDALFVAKLIGRISRPAIGGLRRCVAGEET